MADKPRFTPGGAPGPGRPKGSRNKLAEDFLAKLHDDFTANGEQAIKDARAADPMGYVKVVAGLLPKELTVKRELEDVSDAELDALIDRIQAELAGGAGREAPPPAGEPATGVPPVH